MKRRAKERLPPIPSGREWLDMAWRDATAMAVPILESLPEHVDDRWATADGIRAFIAALLRAELATQQLRTTAARSTLARTRERALRSMERLLTRQARAIAAALKRRIEADWPKAAPEQVLLLIGERFRLLSEKVAAEMADAL